MALLMWYAQVNEKLSPSDVRHAHLRCDWIFCLVLSCWLEEDELWVKRTGWPNKFVQAADF